MPFAIPGAVPETSSLFMYASKLTYSYNQDQTFLPSFVYPGTQPGCDGNVQCDYDYVNWGGGGGGEAYGLVL